MNTEKILTGLVCPYCHKETESVHPSKIFPLYLDSFKRNNYRICFSCNAYVMENGNGIGIGRLSCKKLRAVKRYAYDLFLPFCAAKQKKANLSKEEATSLANLWLKTEMNSDIDNFNIEKLNYEETFKAIKILTYYTNKVKERNKNILKATY